MVQRRALATMAHWYGLSNSAILLPINVKFGTGEADLRSAPRAKFHIYLGKNVGTQPPKLSKFRILAINLPLRGHSFAQFF